MIRNFKGHRVPTEPHTTAAIADTGKIKKDSQVTIPSDLGVENAKDYVEENQK